MEIPQDIIDNLSQGGNEFGMDDPNAMGADPMGDPNAMDNDPMGDPNAMNRQDPNGMGDPNAMDNDPMGGDPNAMGEEPTENGSPLDNQINDALAGITNDKDKETILSYINSIVDKDSNGVNDVSQNDPMQQMQESFVKEMNLVAEPRQGKRNKKEIAKPRKSPWIF